MGEFTKRGQILHSWENAKHFVVFSQQVETITAKTVIVLDNFAWYETAL